MNVKIKPILVAVLAALLCTCLLAGTTLTALASDTIDLNFGISGAENNDTLLPSDLFEALYPSLTLSDAEGDYLNGKLLPLVYNDSIPQDTVRTHYNKDSGVLDIYATPYTFVASNGTRVAWIPHLVTIEGDTDVFEKGDGDEYVCHFDGLHYADDFEMAVDFSWSVTLPEGYTDALLFQSEIEGKTAAKLLSDYDEAMKLYNAELAAYRAYAAYEERDAAYKAYLEAYSKYLAQKEQYDAYVAAKAKYDKELAAYNQYLKDAEEYRIAWEKYQAYSDFMTKYGQEYANYIAYQRQMDRILAKLEIMEMMFRRDSNGWSLYRDIQGKTVTTVLDRKDELIQIGYTRAEDAAKATEVLRVVLKGYAPLRTQKYASSYEKYKTLYAYYTEHYETIKKNFIQLYEALYNLYANGIIIDKLESEGKGAHFRQFLASLYIACSCLDDTSVMSNDWKPGEKFKGTLSTWVESVHLISDNIQASPLGVVYPAEEVKQIVPPEQVDAPGDAPKRVDPPSTEEPKPVVNPTAPTVVADPGDAPPYAEKPTVIPQEPSLTEAQRAWATACQSVDFSGREGYRDQNTLTLEHRLTRSVSIDNSFKITFYAHDGKTVCFEQVLRYGDSARLIDYSHRPKREDTAQYYYEFVAWTLFNGDVWNGDIVESDLSFIPYYRTTTREYTVSWIVDGVLLEQKYVYGVMPTYPYLLQKEPTDYESYVFSGWDREIGIVTGDATYTGFFIAGDIIHTVTWKYANGMELVQNYAAHEMPAFEGVLNYADSTHYYRFKYWDTPIQPVSGNVTYRAVYEAEPFSMDSYGNLTEVEHTDTSLVVKIESAAVYLENLAKYALENNKEIILESGGVSLVLPVESVEILQTNGCRKIVLAQREENLGTVYTVQMYDLFGSLLQIDAPATFVARCEVGAGNKPVCYRQRGEEWVDMNGSFAGGVLRAACTVSEEILLRTEYYLTYESTANCNPLGLLQAAPAGAWVDLRTECAYGYELTGAVITYADGRVVTADGLGFYMPAQEATVALRVEKIVYRVNFVVDGKIVDVREYAYGEEIALPADPTLEKNDGFVYTFTGWSPDVTLAIGEERELVFEATFLAGKLSDNEVQQQLVDHSITKRLILLGSLAGILLLCIVLAIVFRKRIHAIVFYRISVAAAKHNNRKR